MTHETCCFTRCAGLEAHGHIFFVIAGSATGQASSRAEQPISIFKCMSHHWAWASKFAARFCPLLHNHEPRWKLQGSVATSCKLAIQPASQEDLMLSGMLSQGRLLAGSLSASHAGGGLHNPAIAAAGRAQRWQGLGLGLGLRLGTVLGLGKPRSWSGLDPGPTGSPRGGPQAAIFPG